MKSHFVKEIQPNQVFTTFFLVQSKEIRQKKSGEPYLSLLLCDRTGELDAKMWDNVGEVIDAFDRDDFVSIKGLIQIFHNRPQLTIHKMKRVADNEVDFADYFPASERNRDEMLAELRGIVAGMGNPHLRALLTSLLDDPEIANRYKIAPAAKQIHHAYLGGLIEHVLSLCGMAKLAASHYKQIDLDLLLTGVVLHDLGKIRELNYDRGFSYSTEGQLLGHITIGMQMVAEKFAWLPDFPPRLRTLVEHMILSHHGRLEFGSPKLPQFPEALLLHYLDDLDSKMECMRAMVDHDRQVEGNFTSYSASMERSVLKKSRFLDAAAAKPETKPVNEAPRAPASDAAVKTPPSIPPIPPVPAAATPPAPPPASRPPSFFGDKLLQALIPARGKES